MRNGVELALLTKDDNWENLEWYATCPICCGQGTMSRMAEDGYDFDLSDYDLQDAIPYLLQKGHMSWLQDRMDDESGYSVGPDDENEHDEVFQDWLDYLDWTDFDFDNEDDLPFLLDALTELGAIEEGDFDEDGNCNYCDGDGNNDGLYWSYVWETYVAGNDDHEAAKTARRHGCYLFGNDGTWYIVFNGCGYDASWVLAYGAYKVAGYLQPDLTPDSTGGSVFISEEARKVLAAEIVDQKDHEASWLYYRNELARMTGKPEAVARLMVPKVGSTNDQTVLEVALDLERYASDARVEIYKQWAMSNVPVSEGSALQDQERAAKLLILEAKKIRQEVKAARRTMRKLYWSGVWFTAKTVILNNPLVKFWRNVGTNHG